jgi:hypothetical protein
MDNKRDPKVGWGPKPLTDKEREKLHREIEERQAIRRRREDERRRSFPR